MPTEDLMDCFGKKISTQERTEPNFSLLEGLRPLHKMNLVISYLKELLLVNGKHFVQQFKYSSDLHQMSYQLCLSLTSSKQVHWTRDNQGGKNGNKKLVGNSLTPYFLQQQNPYET